MILFNRKYHTGVICDAAGVTNSSLQTWLARGLILGQRDISGAGSPGHYRQFSFNNLMEIAIAKALIDTGIKAKAAFHASHYISHVGWDKDEIHPARYPALPAHQDFGETFLAVSGTRFWVGCWTPNNQKQDFMGSMYHALGKADAYTMVSVSKVFNRVCDRLGPHPFDVLDEAYENPRPDIEPMWPEGKTEQ